MIKGILALYIRVSAFLLYGLVVLINRTLKVKLDSEEFAVQLREQGKKTISLFWHQGTFVLFYRYRKEKVTLLTAKSLRGEILTRVIKKLGYNVIRVSESAAAGDRVKSLKETLACMKEGYNLGIAADGPLGPCYEMKPGPVYLASKMQYALVPVAVAAEKAMVLRGRWDRYFIPWPWSTVWLKFGEPIYVSENLSTEQIEEVRKKTEKSLKDLDQELKNKVGMKL
jgi:lysophospholipid acyltransferase (LPLAT)-like uncharacterized protein